MMNEIGPIMAVRPSRNRPVGGHQPVALIIVDRHATELWHQWLLSIDQRSESLYLGRPAAFGFQAFDEAKQQQVLEAVETFVDQHYAAQLDLIDAHPLGTWVCLGTDGLTASHRAFVLDRARGDHRGQVRPPSL